MPGGLIFKSIKLNCKPFSAGNLSKQKFVILRNRKTLMKRFIFIIALIFLGSFQFLAAQKITYSPIIREDNSQINFEILGKVGPNYLVYKKVRWKHMLQVFNKDMVQISNDRMSFLPDKVFNVDFVTYPDYFFLIFQYQKGSTVYCKGVKIDAFGKKQGDLVLLDSTRVGLLSNNRIYNIMYSENKSKILVYKLHKRSGDLNMVTKRFDNNLNLLDSLRQNLDYNERREVYSDFQIADNGTIVFAKQVKTGNRDNINNLDIITSKLNSGTFEVQPINLDGKYIDEVQINIDNINNNYLVNSFYYIDRRGNIEGLFNTILTNDNKQTSLSFMRFSDSVRARISNSGEYKFAFNNLFIKNVFLKRNGGYIMVAEDFTSQNRYNNNRWNRWDYLYDNPFGYSDYYSYNRFGYYRPYYYSPNSFSSTSYNYDNLLILGVDSSFNLNWEEIIFKKQADEDTDNFLSFTTMNSGSEIHFLYIEKERRAQVISNVSITPTGNITRYPTLKSRENGYLYMPRLGKQVGLKQMIIPCMYRDFISFAKIDFSLAE